MKELKKSIVQLEKEKLEGLKYLHQIDNKSKRDERLNRVEKILELESIDSEIEDKKMILSNAKLLPKKRSHLRVAIGSVVDLIDKHGHFFRFTIVDSVEADPSNGRISTLSPLGRSLIGKTSKDIIKWGGSKEINYGRLIRIM